MATRGKAAHGRPLPSLAAPQPSTAAYDFAMLRVIVFTCLFAGCLPGADEPSVRIFEINVDESEGNWSSNLEVEVHLYDFETEAMVGCAELSSVQQGNHHYDVSEMFELTVAPGDDFVRLIDIEARDVYLFVVERDLGRCPEPPSYKDDIIGRTPPFRGGLLQTRQDLSFESVTHMSIGAVWR